MNIIAGADYSKARTDLDFIRLLKTTPTANENLRQIMIADWQRKYEKDVREAEKKALERQHLQKKWAVTESTIDMFI